MNAMLTDRMPVVAVFFYGRTRQSRQKRPRFFMLCNLMTALQVAAGLRDLVGPAWIESGVAPQSEAVR